MNTKPKPEILTDEHLQFLDGLRESGITNMYGAGPFLRDEFGLTRRESHEVLAYWMATFAERHAEECSE